jgi:hypothetical protein
MTKEDPVLRTANFVRRAPVPDADPLDQLASQIKAGKAKAERGLRGMCIGYLQIGKELPADLDLATWEAVLREVSRARSMAQWRIGDLLNFGENRYGEQRPGSRRRRRKGARR